jgi:hypothetical protein
VSGGLYNPVFAVVPGFAPALNSLWLANPSWRFPFANYRSLTGAAKLDADDGSPSFDIGGYDAMWNDGWFGEIAAYGGLERDAQRIAGMRPMGDGDAGTVPYGRLTLQREFQQGRQSLGLGAYGLTASVRPTAISGFGDDSYTDVAVDGTWRWVMHPQQSVSDTISAHALILRENEDLIASHDIFGTNRNDALTIVRGDVSWSWGACVMPTVQYFQVTGSSDPVRLGTPDGIPDSKGWMAGLELTPRDQGVSPLAHLNARLSLQYIAYSKFDGSAINASQNNIVLLHLSLGGE